MSEPKSNLTKSCGPHCGSKDGYTGHCKGCHDRTCEGSRYDREKVRP